MRLALRKIWSVIREVTGDDAYERYLEHWRAEHSTHGSKPLDRASFYRDEQRRKWDGIRRCC
jgi:uncharacterized short protein YbdD (DUF466 family)